MALPVIQFVITIALAVDVRYASFIKDTNEAIDSVHYQTVLLTATEITKVKP